MPNDEDAFSSPAWGGDSAHRLVVAPCGNFGSTAAATGYTNTNADAGAYQYAAPYFNANAHSTDQYTDADTTNQYADAARADEYTCSPLVYQYANGSVSNKYSASTFTYTNEECIGNFDEYARGCRDNNRNGITDRGCRAGT